MLTVTQLLKSVAVKKYSAGVLQLEAGVALLPVVRHPGRHRLRRLLGDGPVKDEVLAVAAAEQGADRLPGGLAEDVPAGHVDPGLDVGVPLEGGVHPAVEL